jgi:tRNA threonylcarbamoyladenosine biosynthesis protein TsaE
MPASRAIAHPAAASRTAAGVPARPALAETRGAVETEALGARIAATLQPGDVVLLRGELGSGKTTLARGIARALGVSDPVTSPTFTIGQRYRGERVAVAHLDLYRIAGLGDEEPGLLEDYLDGATVALVEWPPQGSRELPPAALVVTLEHAGGECRRIEVEERR